MQETTIKRPTTPPSPKKYPIRVVYVYRPPCNYRDETLCTIRDWCKEINVDFNCREYDSFKYREDRDEIERLPAIHLYEDGRRESTFYPNGRPLQRIEDSYNKFLRKEHDANTSKKAWQEKLQFWRDRITNAFRPKTRMEKYEEEQRAHTARVTAQRRLSVPNLPSESTSKQTPTTPSKSRSSVLSSRF